MKFLATALVAAAYSAESALAQTALGQSCVDATLVAVFNRINAVRTLPAAAPALLEFQATVTSESSAEKNRMASGPARTAGAATNKLWSMRQNLASPGHASDEFSVSMVEGRAKASNDEYITAPSKLPCPTCAVTWSEGLALGQADYLTEWAAAAGGTGSFSSLTTPTGTTTASRAGAHGVVTGKILEAAYFYEAYSQDATDLMRLLLVNDGTNALRDAFLTKGALGTNPIASYKTMAAAYK